MTHAESAAWVARYLRHIRTEKRLAERTAQLYQHDLERLQTAAQAAGIGLQQVSSAHIRSWLAQAHGAQAEPATLALRLSVWRGFYTWLGHQGQIAANPCAGVRAPKRKQVLPKALAVDAAVQLAEHAWQLAQASAEGEARAAAMAWRDVAMLELLYGSGLRMAELVGLDVTASQAAERAGRGWVDLAAQEVWVQGKGSKRRSSPVGRKSLLALERYLALRPCLLRDAQQSALFLGARGGRIAAATIDKALKSLAHSSGLGVDLHAHVLRHSFASHVLQSSGDLRAVQELLGHANIRTTQIYTRLDFQHLAQTYDAAHPRAKKKDTEA